VPCEHCDTQLKSFVLEFAGVTTPDPACDCSNDVDAFWNDTSFITANCCDCDCTDSRYIDDPDDPYFMGSSGVLYEATQVTVTVIDNAMAADYSQCPCDDVQAIFIKTGLIAPYDCENVGSLPFDSQDSWPTPGGTNLRTDWSGATCTMSAS
jgi:hypothetical protein